MSRFKKIYDLAVSFLNLLFDTVLLSVLSRNGLSGDTKYILVVKLDAIGDFVLWLDSAVALKKLFPSPEYKLVLLGNEQWQELSENRMLFDEYIFVDTYRLCYWLKYRLWVWRKLNNYRWDYTIHPTYSRDLNCGDAAVRISRATSRIGWFGDFSNQLSFQKWFSNRWYTKLFPPVSKPLMELERNAEFIRNLGVNDFKANLPKLPLKLQLPEHFAEDNYVVIVPGASLPLKCWPLDHFAVIAKRIYNDMGIKVVVCGGPNETILGQKLLAMTAGTNPSGIEDWTGKTSLLEFASIIKKARLLIGNDSSAVHLALAVGTPAVCIVGGGHFGRFMPYRLEVNEPVKLPVPVFHSMDCYGCNLKCTHGANGDSAGPCISLISVEQVWSEVEGFLNS